MPQELGLQGDTRCPIEPYIVHSGRRCLRRTGSSDCRTEQAAGKLLELVRTRYPRSVMKRYTVDVR